MSSFDSSAISARNLAACRLTFLLSGAAMGAWAPLVPYARERAGIEDAQLGLLLLCLGCGSMVMMPLAGWVVSRIGCRRTIFLAASAVALSLAFLASVSSFPALVAFLLLFGAAVGTADVTMNIQGVIVERACGRSMMSGFHGLFSLGCILSAASLSALLWLGASPLQAVCGLLVAGALVLVIYGNALLPYGEGGASSPFIRPSAEVLLFGGLCFIAFLVEGALLDWSAVFLATTRGVDKAQAGLGYAFFSLTMAAGRLCGDRIVNRLGERSVLVAGSLLGICGMALAVALPHWSFALLGFVLVGAGISNMVPVFCSLAGRQRRMPVGMAIAAMTGIGYLGILLGPALIGGVAHLASLSLALAGSAGLLLIVVACAPWMTRKRAV